MRLVREGAAGKARGASSSTQVESTVDGTVLTVPVKEGSSVINANSFNPGTTVAVVADMTDMIFKGRVDESEVGKLRKGMPVEIVVGALEDTKFVGHAGAHRPQEPGQGRDHRVRDRGRVPPAARMWWCAPATAPTPTSCSTAASRCWPSTRAC